MPLRMLLGQEIMMIALPCQLMSSFLVPNPISWSSKKQNTMARSSTKVKYRVVASTATKVNWVQNLLHELNACTGFGPPMSYFDNVGATYVYANLVFHSWMKHIAMDFHFVRDKCPRNCLSLLCPYL
ncbi:Retrovirus-related Pol polyprotein from transposon RE2 [Vitis vinifera]|uniref:Retrovirus-related Pol polyprotein from transposon RE2 n=1 Tax=Vitis vinifera TaxID=29760 RepID=A0A438GGR1_VITVI|nr:Retrovirus-related Pol polyprotein from transposon RE2 [Vitis vinifera]